MAKKSNPSGFDTIHTPENHGVTYEELKGIMQHRYSNSLIGDNDTM